ncbi:putative pentatricopeptide [Lupinus albus]|uniref:Putative pentatricopeptide n=1 Tax=Lupinus albus TaxID=3870 RepID=A0A6A4NJC4_LUPAL|nr:putative pentatricopeptide [Lupinus albus]
MLLIQLPATFPIIKGSAENVLIDGIRFSVLPDVVIYNTLINAYCRFFSFDASYVKCLLSKSLNLFDEILQRGIHLYVWSYNILMNCFFKFGKPNEANRIFMDIVLGEFRLSPTTYNVMINELCKNGYINNALALFRNLQRHGFIPQILT